MTKPSVKPKTSTKQKHGQLVKANNTNKHAKKSWIFNFCLVFDPILIANKKFYLNHVISSCQFDFFHQFDFFRQFDDLQILEFLPTLRFFLLGTGQETFSFFSTNQSSFNFLPPVFQRFRCFLLIDLLGFSSPSPIRVWRFFIYNYNYAYNLLIYLSKLAS